MMKYAMTLDGKIATYKGQSKWITGEKARQKVHEDRSRFMAIMIGVETLLKDDPQLTARIKNGINQLELFVILNFEPLLRLRLFLLHLKFQQSLLPQMKTFKNIKLLLKPVARFY